MKKIKSIRHNWKYSEVKKLFDLSFNDLLYNSQSVHRKNFKSNKVQLSTLLSIKTGSCPEDCSYCPQSAHHNTNLKKEKLIELQKVEEAAIIAKNNGSTRFCMGAAWREIKDNQDSTDGFKELIQQVYRMVIHWFMIAPQVIGRLHQHPQLLRR